MQFSWPLTYLQYIKVEEAKILKNWKIEKLK